MKRRQFIIGCAAASTTPIIPALISSGIRWGHGKQSIRDRIDVLDVLCKWEFDKTIVELQKTIPKCVKDAV